MSDNLAASLAGPAAGSVLAILTFYLVNRKGSDSENAQSDRRRVGFTWAAVVSLLAALAVALIWHKYSGASS